MDDVIMTWNPPIDRGWAWVVVACTFMLQMLSVGQLKAFGVIHAEMMRHNLIDSDTIAGVLPVALALFTGLSSVAVIVKAKIGLRSTIWLGVGAISVGNILSACVVRRVPVLMYVTYGVIGGLGTGAVMICATIAIKDYFSRHTTLAMGICFAGNSFGAFIWPHVYRALINSYGIEMTLAICGVMALQGIPAAALIRPIESYRHRNTGEYETISMDDTLPSYEYGTMDAEWKIETSEDDDVLFDKMNRFQNGERKSAKNGIFDMKLMNDHDRYYTAESSDVNSSGSDEVFDCSTCNSISYKTDDIIEHGARHSMTSQKKSGENSDKVCRKMMDSREVCLNTQHSLNNRPSVYLTNKPNYGHKYRNRKTYMKQQHHRPFFRSNTIKYTKLNSDDDDYDDDDDDELDICENSTGIGKGIMPSRIIKYSEEKCRQDIAVQHVQMLENVIFHNEYGDVEEEIIASVFEHVDDNASNVIYGHSQPCGYARQLTSIDHIYPNPDYTTTCNNQLSSSLDDIKNNSRALCGCNGKHPALKSYNELYHEYEVDSKEHGYTMDTKSNIANVNRKLSVNIPAFMTYKMTTNFPLMKTIIARNQKKTPILRRSVNGNIS